MSHECGEMIPDERDRLFAFGGRQKPALCPAA